MHRHVVRVRACAAARLVRAIGRALALSSTRLQRARLALAELGLEYETRETPLSDKPGKSGGPDERVARRRLSHSTRSAAARDACTDSMRPRVRPRRRARVARRGPAHDPLPLRSVVHRDL